MYLWLNVYGNIFVQALRWQQQLQWVHKYYGYSISIKTSSHDTFCYHPAPIFFLPPLLQCFLSLGCPFQGWPLIITWILVHVWAISLYINYGSLQKKKGPPLTKLRTRHIYGYKHKCMGGSFTTCSFSNKNYSSSTLNRPPFDFPSQESWARFIMPVMNFHCTEQTSNSIRNYLANAPSPIVMSVLYQETLLVC